MSTERETLEEAADQFRQASEALETARETTRKAIVNALEAGMTPTEVNNLSPFTPAYNRRIAKEAGVEPRPKGPKKKAS